MMLPGRVESEVLVEFGGRCRGCILPGSTLVGLDRRSLGIVWFGVLVYERNRILDQSPSWKVLGSIPILWSFHAWMVWF
jgi:hypothetical protein